QRLLFIVILLAFGSNTGVSLDLPPLPLLLNKSAEFIPNTIAYAGIAALKLDTELPTFFAAAANGILCEAEDSTIDGKIAAAVFPSGVTDEQRAELAKYSGERVCTPEIAANPNSTYEKCSCKDLLTPPFCATKAVNEILKLKYTKKDCKEVALTNLKAKGWKMLGNAYDEAALKNQTDNVEKMKNVFSGKVTIDEITQNETVDAAKFLCDSLDQTVETAVENLMASDYSYMNGDIYTTALLFGSNSHKAMIAACADAEFVASDMGKCLCKFKTGGLFCFYKSIAQFLKTQNYLICPPLTTASPTSAQFYNADKTKKPASIPQGTMVKPRPAPVATATTTAAPAPTPAPASSTADLLSLLSLVLPALVLAH
ncbi:hypothetical protein PFISCL1PPCAC_11220, partial [Pristionchus fissidentatus]